MKNPYPWTTAASILLGGTIIFWAVFPAYEPAVDSPDISPSVSFNGSHTDSGFYSAVDDEVVFICYGEHWKTLAELTREDLITIFVKRDMASLCPEVVEDEDGVWMRKKDVQ